MERILLALAALGDRTFGLADELSSKGFSAFLPYQRYVESFAADAPELEIHREYMKESAKAMIADGTYKSVFMKKLRDAAATSNLRHDPSTAWIAKLHSDPCEQHAFLLKVRSPSEYAKREREMLDQRVSRLAEETQRHASGMSRNYPLGMLMKPLRFKFAVDVMEQELATLGFQPTGWKPSSGAVVARKAISEHYDIGWSIDDPPLFFHTPTHGLSMLRLQVRAAMDGRSIEGLTILFPTLVYGFSLAYTEFKDLDTLETQIKARVQLYRLIAPQLERIVAEAL